MNILPVLLLLTLHFKITDIQGYGFCCWTVWGCFKVYVFQIICVCHCGVWLIYDFFLNFDNYCLGPSVRQLIAMMVPSVYELISHIYFVSCIKYVYDWKIKYISISIYLYYGRALGPEGKLLFVVLATFYLEISTFITRNFDFHNSKFRVKKSKFRDIKSKFRLFKSKFRLY